MLHKKGSRYFIKRLLYKDNRYRKAIAIEKFDIEGQLFYDNGGEYLGVAIYFDFNN